MTARTPDLPETVRYEDPAPGVRLLTIDRPKRMNAIGPVESRGLFTAIARFRDDPGASVLVITGAGREAFCAGADLVAVAAMFDPADPAVEPLFDPADPAARPIPAEGNIGPTRWTAVHKPIIAAVNGAAYAGGLEWACLAHLRIADQHASFGVTCRRWNVGLGDGGTQRLPRLIGLSRALELIITGRVIGATEAERIGLVNEVTASGGCVDRAVGLAAEIAALPQPALRTDLEATVRGFGRPLEDGLRIEAECFNRLLDEPELVEGTRRFLNRDHPDRKAGAGPLHLPAAAYAFAVRAHAGRPGKYGRGEFIDHPARVARITARSGGDDLAVAAAYLHDTLEHSAATREEIEATFGPELAGLVVTLSQDPAIPDREARREDHRQRIATAGSREQLVWMADRLDGIRAMGEALASAAGPHPASAGPESVQLPDGADTMRRISAWNLDLELARRAGIAPALAAEATDGIARLEAVP